MVGFFCWDTCSDNPLQFCPEWHVHYQTFYYSILKPQEYAQKHYFCPARKLTCKILKAMGTKKVSMSRLIIIRSFLLILLYTEVSGQSVETEVAGMTRYTSLTGSFHTPITKSRKLSLLLAGRYYINYSDENLAAVFSSIGYSFSPTFTATAGAMYFGSTLTPMMGMQVMLGKKAVTGMFAPSLTFGEELSLMMISQVQYIQAVTEKTSWVNKMMLLGFFGFNGDIFSRLSFRSGLKKGKFGYGLAADADMLLLDELELSATIGAYLQYSLSFQRDAKQQPPE